MTVNEHELARVYAALPEDLRRLWEAACPGVDGVLRQFAEEHGATIEAWIGESPSRLVRWHDDLAEYSLSLLLETGSHGVLHIWPMAWRDDEARLRRLVLRLADERLTAPVHGETVVARLETAAKRLSLVREAVVPGRAALLQGTKQLFDWSVEEVTLAPAPTAS